VKALRTDVTELKLSLGRLEARMEAFEAQLGARLTAFEAQMSARFAALDAQMAGRFGAIEGRFGAIEGRLQGIEGRFSSLPSSLQLFGFAIAVFVAVGIFRYFEPRILTMPTPPAATGTRMP
jgi:hypothetical protein